jgi:hypothetical protein
VIVQLPPIDLDAYRVCLFQIPIPGSLLYTSLSLVFGAYTSCLGGNFRELNCKFTDLAVFLVVIARARALRMGRCNSTIPKILDAVTKDTSIYFLFIFSSHLVLFLMLMFARVRACNVVWIQSFSLSLACFPAILAVPPECVSFVRIWLCSPLLTYCPRLCSSGTAM